MDDVACTIDDKTKVFTALSNNEKLGIQYQPDSNGGAGTWVNVKTSTAYTWDGSSTELHYYNSADGSKTLMHATLNSVRGVLVSAMDNPTMTMNQSPAQWSFVRFIRLMMLFFLKRGAFKIRLCSFFTLLKYFGMVLLTLLSLLYLLHGTHSILEPWCSGHVNCFCW
jgi:hypothetical protein